MEAASAFVSALRPDFNMSTETHQQISTGTGADVSLCDERHLRDVSGELYSESCTKQRRLITEMKVSSLEKVIDLVQRGGYRHVVLGGALLVAPFANIDSCLFRFVEG